MGRHKHLNSSIQVGFWLHYICLGRYKYGRVVGDAGLLLTADGPETLDSGGVIMSLIDKSLSAKKARSRSDIAACVTESPDEISYAQLPTPKALWAVYRLEKGG